MRLLLLAVTLLVACATVPCHASLPPLPKFNCPALPAVPPPKDVRHLHPSHIEAMGALGDSISAGFAMHSDFLVNGLVEYRGDVFSIGGNDGAYTLPNFFQRYASKPIVGPPTGVSPPLDAIKFKKHIVQPFAPESQGNAAQSMAKIDMVPAQVDRLVEVFKGYAAEGKIDYEKSWKVVTVLIGPNNLCISCDNNGARPDGTAAYYAQYMNTVLESLHKQMPRVFVNWVVQFNISSVHTIATGHPYCVEFHKIFDECPCLMRHGDVGRQTMDDHTVAINRAIYKVAKEWQARNIEDFTVVAQPALENFRIWDVDLISHLDCFHPSWYADAGMAMGVWNNMLTPEAEKRHDLDPRDIDFKCPTVDSVLQ